jgi:hypothetical protein
MSEHEFVADEDLDPETREALRAFTTARTVSGGVLWPGDEVPGELPAEPFPAEWEAEIERRAAEEADQGADADDQDRSIPGAAQSESASNPLITAEVRRRQAARLERLAGKKHAKGRRSRWRHVPLAQLFEAAGNTLYEQRDGTVETGHEPCHRSASGRCVVLDPAKGVFWCRSCRTGGTAVTLLQQLRGWTRGQAVRHLTRQYGAPSRAAHQRVSMPRRVLEA